MSVQAKKVSFVTNNRLDLVTGCWNWTGATGSRGYGRIVYADRLQLTHRVSAHIYLGFDLNSPLQVLHRCDNPSCFNPKHLFIGTQAENLLDMSRKGRHHNSRVTHCPNGHAYDAENTRFRKNNGARECKACTRAALLRHKSKQREIKTFRFEE